MDRYRVIILSTALACLCVTSISRTSIYQDEITLYTDITEKSPAKARPHNNLADALIKAGRINEAPPHLEQALAIDPNYADALNNLATVYGHNGKTEISMELLRRTLAIAPGHVQARFNLAMYYYERGQVQEAERDFLLVVEAGPATKEAAFSRKMLAMIRMAGSGSRAAP